jgi:hypothetical protein
MTIAIQRLLFLAFVMSLTMVLGAKAVPGGQSSDSTPVVAEVFALRRANLALKQQVELLGSRLTVCEAQLAPERYKASMAALELERQRLIADFEAAHPGWTLDTKTGTPTKKGGGS